MFASESLQPLPMANVYDQRLSEQHTRIPRMPSATHGPLWSGKNSPSQHAPFAWYARPPASNVMLITGF